MTGNIVEFAAHRRGADTRLQPQSPRAAPNYEIYDEPAWVKRQNNRPKKLKPIKDRWHAWVAARLKVQFFEGVAEAQFAVSLYPEYGAHFGFTGGPYGMGETEIDKLLMQARADLILTPVTNQQDLNDKLRVARRWRDRLPIKPARIDAAIEADRAYLALPRIKRPDAARGKAVRS